MTMVFLTSNRAYASLVEIFSHTHTHTHSHRKSDTHMRKIREGKSMRTERD